VLASESQEEMPKELEEEILKAHRFMVEVDLPGSGSPSPWSGRSLASRGDGEAADHEAPDETATELEPTAAEIGRTTK